MKLCEFPVNKLNWGLLYRGSENNFNWSEFHDKCEHEDPSIVIVKTIDGCIFGGCTKANFGCGGWAFDRDAFVFRLKSNSLEAKKYKVKYPEEALFNFDKTYGPFFGHHDLAFYNGSLFTTLNSTISEQSLGEIQSRYGVPFKPKEFKIDTEIIDVEVYTLDKNNFEVHRFIEENFSTYIDSTLETNGYEQQ